MLADEPIGNLGRATADGVFELMRQLALDQGTAFIVVAHDEGLATRCAPLAAGAGEVVGRLIECLLARLLPPPLWILS